MKKEEILNGIIVQGSLLDTDISQYVAILEENGRGKRFTDPMESMLASVFDICLEGDIDPWAIDLKWFTKIFSTLIDRDFRDFFVAGYLINSAWRILSIKSDRSITRWTSEPEMPDEENAEDLEFQAIDLDPLEVREPVVRSVKRKVFLVELLDAMKESFDLEKRRHVRGSMIQFRDDYNIEKLFDNLHPEEPEKEAGKLLEMIRDFGADLVKLDDLTAYTDSTFQALFVYCMFLTRDRKIELIQEEPFGPIYIRNILIPGQ